MNRRSYRLLQRMGIDRPAKAQARLYSIPIYHRKLFGALARYSSKPEPPLGILFLVFRKIQGSEYLEIHHLSLGLTALTPSRDI